MDCSRCGARIGSTSKFCEECGARRGVGSDNAVNTGGGDIHGGVFQAGGDIIVGPATPEPPIATYEPVPLWRSPLTLAWLSWIGLLLGIAGVIPFWKLVEPIVKLVSGSSADQPGLSQVIWGAVLVVVIFLLILTLSLRRTAKTETRRPLMFGLAISGHGRRITFERIRAEKCPKCGGSVRYYDKPTQWINHREANGRRWREVTERVPALECRRNQKHWFEVDPAETLAG